MLHQEEGKEGEDDEEETMLSPEEMVNTRTRHPEKHVTPKNPKPEELETRETPNPRNPKPDKPETLKTRPPRNPKPEKPEIPETRNPENPETPINQ